MKTIISQMITDITAIMAPMSDSDAGYYDWGGMMTYLDGYLSVLDDEGYGIYPMMLQYWEDAFTAYFNSNCGSNFSHLSAAEQEAKRAELRAKADVQWFVDNILTSASINDIDHVLSLYYRYVNMTAEQQNSNEMKSVKPYVDATMSQLGAYISDLINDITITESIMRFEAVSNAYELAKAYYYYNKYYNVMYELYGSSYAGYMFTLMTQQSVNKLRSNNTSYAALFNAGSNPELLCNEDNIYAAWLDFNALCETGLDVVSDMGSYLVCAMTKLINQKFEAMVTRYGIPYSEANGYDYYDRMIELRDETFASQFSLANKANRDNFLGLIVETNHLGTLRERCAAFRAYDMEAFEEWDDDIGALIVEFNVYANPKYVDPLGRLDTEEDGEFYLTASQVNSLLTYVDYHDSFEGSYVDLTGSRLLFDIYNAVNPGSMLSLNSTYEGKEDTLISNFISEFFENGIDHYSISRSTVQYMVNMLKNYDLLAAYHRSCLSSSVTYIENYNGVFSINLTEVISVAEMTLNTVKAAYDSLSKSTQAQVGYLRNLLIRVDADMILLRMQECNRVNDVRAYLHYVYTDMCYDETSDAVRMIVDSTALKEEWDTRYESLCNGSLSLGSVESAISALYDTYLHLLDAAPACLFEETAALLVYIDMNNVSLSSDAATKLNAMVTAVTGWAGDYYTAIENSAVSYLELAAIANAYSLLRMAGHGLEYSDVADGFSYQTTLFTTEQAQAIADIYVELCDFIHDDAISGKSSFKADGESIEMKPESITFMNDAGDEVSNVSATNADVTWSNIENDNYTIETDSTTGTTGSTNVPAVIRPMPIEVAIGTPSTTQYYDNTTIFFSMDGTNNVYTSDGTSVDPDVPGSIDSDAWTGGISNVVQLFDSAGNMISEPRSALIKGNRFDGVVTIAGYNYLGQMVAKVKDVSGNDKHFFVLRRQVDQFGDPLLDEDYNYVYLRTLDTDGYSNYVVTVLLDESVEIESEDSDGYVYVPVVNAIGNTIQYTIDQRRLELTYNNLLQSWQADPQDITVNRVDDPLNGTEEQDLSSSEFTDLLVADGMLVGGVIPTSVIRVYNNWADDMGIAGVYNRIDGVQNDSSAPLYVNIVNARNRHNYFINMPILQILWLQVEDSINYVLAVLTPTDLAKMGADLQGLYDTRHDPYTPVGKLPILNQKNDIDCIGDVGYSILTRGGSLEGIYDGCGYTIYNMMLASNGLFSELVGSTDNNGNVIGGIVRNLNVVNAVLVSRNDSNVGIIAGTMNKGQLQNVRVNGYVYADSVDADPTLSVGGVVGSMTDTTMSTVSFVGRIQAYSPTTDVYAGAVGGALVIDEAEGNVANDVYTFGTVQARVTDGYTAVSGALIGYVDNRAGTAYSTWATNVDFLADSTSNVMMAESVSYVFGSQAVGNDSDTVDGKTYEDLLSDTTGVYYSTVYTRVRAYLMRDWYLGAGQYSVRGYSSATLGTAANRISINNYRQLQLFRWMPWLSYELPTADMYLPYSRAHDSEFAVHSVLTSVTYSAESQETGMYYRIGVRSNKNTDAGGTRIYANVYAKNVVSAE